MEKHIIVTGVSTVSWKDAIVKTVEEISKTIDYLSNLTILKQRARLSGNKIVEYFVELDVSFIVDRDRENDNQED